MVARTHIAQQSASHPLQNDKESGTTITLKLVHCKIIQLVFFLQPHLNRTPIFMSHLRNMYFMRKELRHYQNLFILNDSTTKNPIRPLFSFSSWTRFACIGSVCESGVCIPAQWKNMPLHLGCNVLAGSSLGCF